MLINQSIGQHTLALFTQGNAGASPQPNVFDGASKAATTDSSRLTSSSEPATTSRFLVSEERLRNPQTAEDRAIAEQVSKYTDAAHRAKLREASQARQVESEKFNLKNTIIMETGGMKGKRKELIRTDLHNKLKAGFGVETIHSEYGMTELLSQAYSAGNGIFNCPNWMCILTRDTEDALTIQDSGKTGGINVIDLANINSCSFIATQDLGKTYQNGTFEVIGRFDNSDIRGCNLMVL